MSKFLKMLSSCPLPNATTKTTKMLCACAGFTATILSVAVFKCIFKMCRNNYENEIQSLDSAHSDIKTHSAFHENKFIRFCDTIIWFCDIKIYGNATIIDLFLPIQILCGYHITKKLGKDIYNLFAHSNNSCRLIRQTMLYCAYSPLYAFGLVCTAFYIRMVYKRFEKFCLTPVEENTQ